MRLLTLADDLSTAGGLERVHHDVNRHLAARGHVIDLLYESDGDLSDSWDGFTGRQVQISGYRRGDLSLRGLRSLASALELGRSTRPDLIYACRHIQLLHAQVAGRFGRTPVICHLHTPPPRERMRRRHLLWLNRTTRLVFVSEFTAAQWVRAGVRPELVEVVPNGIDTDSFGPPDEQVRERVRAELGIAPHIHVVLYLGRFVRQKGVDVLLRAWRSLAPDPNEAKLVLLGNFVESGTASPRTKAFFQDLHRLSDPGTTLWVPHRPDVVPMLWAADVVVVPSIWPDPFPLAVLEAMACERPVVASRVGGIPEALGGRLAANLVEPGDADSLASGLRALQGWRRRDPELGQACRQHVLARFTQERMVDDLEAVFLGLAERRRRPDPVQHV
jgi:glycosyltransferase involved in cell wall biosynthesis